MMPPLNLPAYPFRLVKKDGSVRIFDEIRKKFVVLEPEEWVRQHVVQALLAMGYPRGLIRLEGGHLFNKRQKRTDIVVYDRQANPFLLVECKAPGIPVNQQVFAQAVHYNRVVQASRLALTNGLVHWWAELAPDGPQWYEGGFPPYPAD
jgi:hypothetical protein